MDDKNILVVGGAGYIGAHACKALKKKGYTPVAYDNLCSGNAGHVQWGPLEIGDIRDGARLSGVIEQYKPKAIMHFAALIQVAESVAKPQEYYENNVVGSWCLLKEAQKHAVRHMVFSSTAAVYGMPATETIAETHPMHPINPYGRTKLAMEGMVSDYAAAYGMSYAILRYFNAAGADTETDIGTAYKKDTHLIPLLMQVAAGEMPEIKMFGTDYPSPDGTAVRDYIHVQDLADAHILALEHIMAGKGSLTLNLGTSKGYSVREVIEAARAVTGHPIPCQTAPRRAGDPALLVADASLARTVLNWTPSKSDLETIIGTAWKWKQKQLARA